MGLVALPDIEVPRTYPRVGPRGAHLVDVNGKAATIELSWTGGPHVQWCAEASSLDRVRSCRRRLYLRDVIRLDDDDRVITHEFLAILLGVRHPGITDVVHVLEGKGHDKIELGQLLNVALIQVPRSGDPVGDALQMISCSAFNWKAGRRIKCSFANRQLATVARYLCCL